jgi:arylsulfatase A-like enzyme
MPVLDRLVDEGTLFTNAYTNGPYTRISVPSFHTSRYLAYDRLEELPTIGSEVRAEGIVTAAIGTRTGFKQYEGGLSFDEFVDLGRDEYHTTSNEHVGPVERFMSTTRNVAQRVGNALPESNPLYDSAEKAYHALLGDGFEFKGYTSAKEVTSAARGWIDTNSGDEFFLWLHYMEGHRPYGIHDDNPTYHSGVAESQIRDLMKKAGTQPESVTDSEHDLLIDLYDSDLRYCSQHLTRLFDTLVELDLWNDTAILFTSDHGEEFADHGKYFHRNYPYDELLHVPLLTRIPGRQPATIDEQRELLDLAPTICELHGLDADSMLWYGTNLFEGSARDVIATGAQCSRTPVVTCRRDGWKYLCSDGEVSLFDLESDPAEWTNVANKNPRVVTGFERVIPDRLFELEPEQLEEPTDAVNEGHLEALGYLELEEGDETRR